MKKIGITGQQGFIGTHLYSTLGLNPKKYKLIEFERSFFNDNKKLDDFVSNCEVIIHLAAMNRHIDANVIYKTNLQLVTKLVASLNRTKSNAHILFSSSSQEEKNNPYGKSKKEGKEIFEKWVTNSDGKFTSLIIPNVFGPNGKPFYNSVVATFCHQITNNETPKIINDAELDMISVERLVYEIRNNINTSNKKSVIEIKSQFKVKVSKLLRILNGFNQNMPINDNNLNELEKSLYKTFKSFKKTKKILILGSSGMAGHVIYQYLSKKNEYELFDISYRKKINTDTIILDVRNFDLLEKIIQKIKPDYIINAIGILINEAKLDSGKAILLNSYLPHFLVNCREKNNFKLIHLSTDCVFSGKKGEYTENSFKDADDFYGRSKSLGEIVNKHDLTLRTSIIGPEIKPNGQGLIHWFLNQKKDINGFKNAYWSGVTTLELAKVIHASIQQNVIGLCHVTNNKKISKFDLVSLFKEVWETNFNIEENTDYVSDKSFIDTYNKIKINIPNYKNMLFELKNYMLENNDTFKYINLYQLKS